MKRILIVEDEDVTRDVLQALIESGGYKVAGSAVNGEEGYNKYLELKPDLVILDVAMPETDGIECAKLIRKFDPDAKILICTAHTQNEVILDTLRAGAEDFIMKPFNRDEVVAAIDRILGV